MYGDTYCIMHNLYKIRFLFNIRSFEKL